MFADIKHGDMNRK